MFQGVQSDFAFSEFTISLMQTCQLTSLDSRLNFVLRVLTA